ncbi:MAG: ATP-binding protein [Acidobacteriota bacterium]
MRTPTYTPAPVPPDEEERLLALRSYRILDTPAERAFDELTMLASRICGTPVALVTLIDEQRQWFKSRVGLDLPETPRDQAFCAHAILQDGPFIVGDSHDDPRFAGNPLAIGEANVRFYAGIPLQTDAGYKLGTLCVIDHKPRELSGEQREALCVLARQVVALIEMRKLVDDLALSAKRATESSSSLKAVLDAATEVGIIGMDPKGRITVFNAGAEALLRYAADEVRGMTADIFHLRSELEARAEELRDVFSKPMSPLDALLELPRQGSFDEREWTFVRKDGIPVSVRMVVTASRDDRGEITGFVSVSKDVTDIVRAFASRKELDRAKREFVSTVSHELRTPLTSIRGSLGLLAAGVVGELPNEARHLVEIAERNSTRLMALINDILDFERLDHHKLELRLETQAIEPLLRRSVEVVKTLADQQKIDVRIAPGEHLVSVDADRVTQVLINLLSNAIKFSPPGSVVALDVAKAGGDFVEVRVIDQGRGIPLESQDRIFERFQQVDASDEKAKGGTGLGLAIAKAIIEHHGGLLGVTSDGEGRGSTFWFQLPASTQS